MEALECGAACLAMILAYHGRWEPLEKVREQCGVSRDGSKASNILKAARSYGLNAEGAAGDTPALRENGEFPCIIFWNFNHFVVLDGFRGKYAYLNDPARGEVRVTMEEFEESFTGVVLLFEKTDAFEEGGEKPSTLRYARERLEGMNAAIVFVMLTAAIVSLAGIANTSMGQVFMDRILSGDNPDWLGPLMLCMLILAAVTGSVSILNAVYLVRIRGKIAVVSSSRFMRHLLHLPVRFYAQRMVGDLQQRQSSNETVAFALIGQIAPILVNVVMLVLYLVVMLRYSVLLTAVGVTTVVLNALIAREVSKRRVNISRSSMANAGKKYAAGVSGIEMIETIKAAGAENSFFERWAGYQALMNKDAVRSKRLNEYLGSLPAALTSLANVAVLVLGIWLIVRGEFTPGMLLAFTGFLGSFMTPVNQLTGLGQTIQEMQTQMERIEDVLNYTVDVSEECDDPDEVGGLKQRFGREKLRGQVDLEGVSFGYSPFDSPLVEGFELHVEPGQWVALVGPSGCGKSTIAKLVSGLYEPWNGSVSFDGVPMSEVPRPILRGSLTVVDQDIVVIEAVFGVVSTILTVKYERKSMEADAKVSGVVTALLGGIQKVKLAGAEDLAFAKWAHGYSEYAAAMYNRPILLYALPALVGLVGLLGNILIYYMAATSGVTYDNYMAFNVAFGQTTGAIAALTSIAGQVAQAKPMLDMVQPILDADPETDDDRPSVESLSGAIEVSGVWFRYGENLPYVLRDLFEEGAYDELIEKGGVFADLVARQRVEEEV